MKPALSKKLHYQKRFGTKIALIGYFGQQFGKTIAIFETSILKFVKRQSYVQNLNNKFTTKNVLFAGLWAGIWFLKYFVIFEIYYYFEIYYLFPDSSFYYCWEKNFRNLSIFITQSYLFISFKSIFILKHISCLPKKPR